jgi:hypothetical protein
MIVSFQNAVPKEDYMLEVIMTNQNRMYLNMHPHLNTVQYCPLKDIAVWENIEVKNTSLNWKGSSKVEMSSGELRHLFMKGKEKGGQAVIEEAVAKKDLLLRLWMDNGSHIEMGMEQLLDYPLFAPLLSRGLWQTMQVKEQSLLWEDKNIHLELPLKSILDYFG